LFAAGIQVDVGPGSGNIVLADVDRDGHADMVIQHLLQRKVGVFLGDGKGGFKPASPIALEYQPGSVAVADVDGDGLLDLAVGQSERDAADVFLGDGKGTFKRASASPFAASASREFFTRQVWFADFNGDRRLDIVTANGAANALGMLFGDGRGGFSPGPVTKRESNRQRHAFAFGDVDGDGRVDTVIASRGGPDTPETGRVVILLGDGTGSFKEAGPALAVAPGPRYAALADCNGDRRLDLVICHDNRRISVLLNDGGGRFVQAAGSPLDAGAEAYMVVVADSNGDGRPDLLAATVEDVTVLLGDGRGRFTAAPGSPFRAGPGAYKLATADLNRDGKLDVVASSFEGNAVTVLLGR